MTYIALQVDPYVIFLGQKCKKKNKFYLTIISVKYNIFYLIKYSLYC